MHGRWLVGLIETGKICDNNEDKFHGDPGSWLGAIGYFSVLNQIGNCFKLKSEGSEGKEDSNKIKKALKYFSDLNDDKEINALYALRNSFAHDYSLQNINKNCPELNFCFEVYDGIDGRVVTLPQINWNDRSPKAPENTTRINLRAFGDMVEKLINNLRKLAKDDKVEIALKGGIDEFKDRYFFIVYSGKK